MNLVLKELLPHRVEIVAKNGSIFYAILLSLDEDKKKEI
jgi:small nuclear ribonucleoprotein (snRNP)-like protein